MVEAILDAGVIRPVQPLPENWKNGQRLQIELADPYDMTPEEIDREFAILEEMCESSDPEDERKMLEAIEEMRNLSKQQVRRQMGLS